MRELHNQKYKFILSHILSNGDQRWVPHERLNLMGRYTFLSFIFYPIARRVQDQHFREYYYLYFVGFEYLFIHSFLIYYEILFKIYVYIWKFDRRHIFVHFDIWLFRFNMFIIFESRFENFETCYDLHMKW